MRQGGWHKYKAQKTEIDGVTFASKAEAKRYFELKLLERAKEIFNLELQPKYDLVVNGDLVCRFIPDFRYKTKEGRLVIEDAKGVRTPVYSIKKKLFQALFPGLSVEEIGRQRKRRLRKAA